MFANQHSELTNSMTASELQLAVNYICEVPISGQKRKFIAHSYTFNLCTLKMLVCLKSQRTLRDKEFHVLISTNSAQNYTCNLKPRFLIIGARFCLQECAFTHSIFIPFVYVEFLTSDCSNSIYRCSITVVPSENIRLWILFSDLSACSDKTWNFSSINSHCFFPQSFSHSNLDLVLLTTQRHSSFLFVSVVSYQDSHGGSFRSRKQLSTRPLSQNMSVVIGENIYFALATSTTLDGDPLLQMGAHWWQNSLKTRSSQLF